MGSVENAIEVYDGATLALQNMNTALARTGQRFDDAFSGGRFGAALNGLNMINVFIDKIETNIDHSTTTQKAFVHEINMGTQAEAKLQAQIAASNDEKKKILSPIEEAIKLQNKLTESLSNSTSSVVTLVDKAKNIGVSFLDTGKKIMGASDEMNLTKMKLDAINKGLQTSEQFSQKVFEAAERSRTSYADTADMVYALGTKAKGAFSNEDELIAFTELMNKNYKVGGASAQDQANSMSKLSEAMGAGGIQGDGYKDILQNAPLLAASIEDYMTNVQHAKGSMGDWAAEGLLTADVIKAAMFLSGQTVEEQFGKLPITWAEVSNSIKDNGQMAFQAVLEKIGKITGSTAFQTFKNNLITGFQAIGMVASQLFDVIAGIGNFFTDNWGMIAPFIYGIVAAVVLYTGVLTALNIVQGISNGLKAAAALRAGILATQQAFAAGATFTEMVAVQGLNTALLACPLTWIILIIILVIAAIYGVVAAINHFAGTSLSATGLIAGAFMWLAALIANVFIGAFNGMMQFFYTIFVEPFIGIFEWIFNVINGGFDSLGGAVANLIGQIISWFLSLGMVVTKIIDAIFGTDWTASLEGLKGTVLSWGKNENSMTFDRNAPEINYRVDMTDAFDNGNKWGSELFNSKDKKDDLKDPANNFTDNSSGNPLINPSVNPLDNSNNTDLYDNVSTTADNTSKMAEKVNISDEDLKYLHDVAERDAINRFTTSEIKVDMINNNSIKGTRDIDGIVEYLKNEVETAMSSSAEGV